MHVISEILNALGVIEATNLLESRIGKLAEGPAGAQHRHFVSQLRFYQILTGKPAYSMSNNK